MCFKGGNDGEDAEAQQKNRDIEKMIRADEKKAAREVKLLLLGKPTNHPTEQRPAQEQPQWQATKEWQANEELHRCWRVWKVDSLEADAFDLRTRLFEEREGRVEMHYLQQHPECLQAGHGGNG